MDRLLAEKSRLDKIISKMPASHPNFVELSARKKAVLSAIEKQKTKNLTILDGDMRKHQLS